MTASRQRALYGHPDGAWLLAEYPQGTLATAVPHIGELVYLGDPKDVVLILRQRLIQARDARYERGREAWAAYEEALHAWEEAPPGDRGGRPVAAGDALPPKRGPRPGVQARLAELLGVGQQSVSRYLRDETELDLADEQWANLVRAWFAVTVAV